MNAKSCTTCGVVKPLDAFHRDKTKTDGRESRCADCRRDYRAKPDVKARRRAYMNEYYQKPDAKAKRRDYMRAYRQSPDAKARQREYMRAYRLRRKQEKG